MPELVKIAKNVSTVTSVALIICASVSIGLLIASFLVPPMGEISPSVLRAVGEIFAFATLAVLREAIKEGLSVKASKGDAAIEITQKDEQR